MNREPEIQGLIGHHDGYPWLSRDWGDIDCRSQSCMHNRFSKCTVPSLAKIGEDGRCEGFKPGLLEVKDEEKQE